VNPVRDSSGRPEAKLSNAIGVMSQVIASIQARLPSIRPPAQIEVAARART
jgi:hypothetical protein